VRGYRRSENVAWERIAVCTLRRNVAEALQPFMVVGALPVGLLMGIRAYNKSTSRGVARKVSGDVLQVMQHGRGYATTP